MLKCIEGENTSMCEAIRQMVDEGIMLGEKRGEERGEERGKKQGSMNEKLLAEKSGQFYVSMKVNKP